MMMIITSRGTLTQQGAHGSVIDWNADFERQQTRKYDKLQVFIDNTVTRNMDAYVPLRSSMLKKSVILGSRMGSGMLTYIAPYAHKQYYLENRRHTNGKRGSFWFDRMWAARKETIVREVKNYAKRVMK